MSSPLCPLLANVFICHIQSQLKENNMIPPFYRRCVDDILTTMPNTESVKECLQVFNDAQPSMVFTMELSSNTKAL